MIYRDLFPLMEKNFVMLHTLYDHRNGHQGRYHVPLLRLCFVVNANSPNLIENDPIYYQSE
jgi:hypothetical protein